MCGLGRVPARKDRAPAARLPPAAPGVVAGALTQTAAATLGTGKTAAGATAADEQACAVRMADGTPFAVMPLREEPPVTVPGRMSADAWSLPTGSALNGCRTCDHDYQPATPCGNRCRSRYGCEAAAGLRARGKARGSRSTRSGAAAALGM